MMFEGHTDVVTPGKLADWQYNPFGAEIVGRRMYGRGSCDTKGNLAAMLIAMAALKRSGVKLAGSIIGGVLCDEEDQMIGVRHFIQQGHADKVTAAVICEPEDGMVCTSQKGAVRARYTLTGRMSHGAMPLSGLNIAPAVARLIDGLHELELEAFVQSGKDDLLGWPSFTATVIQAPSAGPPQLNVMPGEALLLVDVRTIPGQSHPDIRNRLIALGDRVQRRVKDDFTAFDQRIELKRSHDLNIDVEFLADRPCTLTTQDDPIVLAADWATQQLTGKEPVHGGVLGATDGSFLWALKHIPIVTIGAGDRQVPHQIDEWVDLDQLIETAKIYTLTALHYLYPGETS
jgi:succinyl-diaminopimelate desuccinylase